MKFHVFVVMCVWVAVIFITSSVTAEVYRMQMETMGTESSPCFPNNTCRGDLRCFSGPGLQPTCLKEQPAEVSP